MPHQKNLVIQEVLKEIETGELGPGSFIDEQKIMDRLGVSRTPVREAIIHLEIEGLVVRIPRKGIQVYKLSLDEFLAKMEVNAKLIGIAAGMAARRMNAADREKLVKVTEAYVAHVEKFSNTETNKLCKLNSEFRSLIWESARNDYLLNLIVLWSRLSRAYCQIRFSFPGVPEKAASEVKK